MGKEENSALLRLGTALYGQAHYDHIAQTVSINLQTKVLFFMKTFCFFLYLFCPYSVKVMLYFVFVTVADTHSLPVNFY